MANTRFRSETGLYVTGDSNTEIQTVSYFKENVNVTKDLTANGITVANNITVSGVSDFQDAVSVIAADPAASASASININTSTEDTSYVFSDGTKAWTINLTSDPSTTVSVGDRISNSTFAYIVINVTNDQNFIAKNLNGQNANPNAANDKTHYERSDAIRLESTGTPGSYLSVDQYGVLISGDTDIATGTLIIQGDLRVEGDQIQIGELLYDGDIVATQSGLTLGGLNSGTTTFDADYHPWTLNSDNIFVGANTSFTATTINQTGPGLFTTQAGNKIGTASYRWDVNARDITANSSILPDATGRALGNSGARWALNSSTINSSSTVTLTSTTGTALSVAGNTAFDTNTLFIDVTNDRVGINTVPGAYALDVAGTIHVANLVIDGTAVITGLNADKLDSISSGSFLRSDEAATKTTGDLTLNDDIHLYLGSGSDLDIYHSGSDSYIEEQGTGNLYIQSTGGAVVVRTNTTENAIECVENGAVTLYYDASAKLSTSAAGADVTGAMDVTGNITASRFISDVAQGTAPFSVTSTTKVTNLNADLLDDISSGSFLRSDVDDNLEANILVYNLKEIRFANSSNSDDDTLIRRNAGGGMRFQSNTGGVFFHQTANTTFNVINSAENTIFQINPEGATNLYHNESSKLATNSGGVTITGTATATTFSGSGASLTSLNGSNISTGTVAAGRLPSVNIGTTSVPLSRASGALTLNDVYLGTGSRVYAGTSGSSFAYKVPFLNTTSATAGSTDVIKDSGGEFTYNPSTNTLAVPIISATTVDATTGTFDTLTTSALTASSTTKVTNLNADLLDGFSSGSFLRSDVDTIFTGGTYIRLNDNKEIRFGTGSDFIFDFNGTNLIINENVGGNILITNTTDATTVTIDPTAGSISMAGDLVPDTDNTGAVGNSAFTWSNGQFTNFWVDSVISVRGALDLADNDEIRLGSSDDFLIDFNGTNLIINENVGGNILITNTTDATTVTIDPTAGSISMAGDLVPDTDNTGAIGNSTYTWNSGYFTNMTVDSTISVRGALDLADNDDIRLGSSDDFIIDFNGTNLVIHENVGGNILITNTSDTTKVTINPTTGSIDSASTITGTQLISDIASGTAPLVVASTTKVTNLNADLLDGYNTSETNVGSTIVARNSSGDIYQRYAFATYVNMSHSTSTRSSDATFYSSNDDYIRKNNASGMQLSLNAQLKGVAAFWNGYGKSYVQTGTPSGAVDGDIWYDTDG